MLPMGSSLRSLSFAFNPIGPAGAEALASALSTSRAALLSLHLSSAELGGTGAAAIARALSTGATIERLDLDRNAIGDEGARGARHAHRMPMEPCARLAHMPSNDSAYASVLPYRTAHAAQAAACHRLCANCYQLIALRPCHRS